ncbi:MAG: SMP-30/gluconolactonase/LRE family protein [Gemmatimonadaceae bacterium]
MSTNLVTRASWALVALAQGLCSTALVAQVTGDAPARRPAAVVDLRTAEGAAAVGGVWRYRDAAIVPVAHRAPGSDLKPSGAPTRTFDIEPRAEAALADDAGWEVAPATSLEQRRGPGRLSFGWYRLDLTLPPRIGATDIAGSSIVFEIVVDDYAEVWVDGKLSPALGQSGGQLVRGWNAPNRVVIVRDARAGRRIRLAILAANGPLSDPPPNYLWVRSATLEIYPQGKFGPQRVAGRIERIDAALDAVVDTTAVIERVATGFTFTEGPVWHPDGYLLFSDPNDNTIYRWSPDGQVSVYRVKSGYAGTNIGEYRQPGSNGLTLDKEGRLTINEHGNRRVTRLERNGVLTVLADNYEGKRLNSPNDLVYKSDGSLYFTDPPFGLPKVYDDARKELPYSGVFRLADGKLTLVARDLRGPNGIALSPDERFLYVADWDERHKVVTRYEVRTDGSLANPVPFFDFNYLPGDEALDGLKVDERGDLFVSAPGGVYVISPQGKLLGIIRPPERPANFAWGDDDGRTLYMTAPTSVYRVRMKVAGVRPGPAPVMQAGRAPR